MAGASRRLDALTAPVFYGWISGYVLALGGAINLLGLAVAAAASQPPHGME